MGPVLNVLFFLSHSAADNEEECEAARTCVCVCEFSSWAGMSRSLLSQAEPRLYVMAGVEG